MNIQYKNKSKMSKFLLGAMFLFMALAFNNVSAQSVTIEKAFASGCYYYSGASKTTISVQVGWTGASSADQITVTLDGSATRIIKPQSMYDPGTGSAVAGPMVTPQVVAFEINSDGAAHTLKAVLSGAHSATSATVSVNAPSPCAPVACTGTELGGMVYYDNNADGTHQAGETQGIGGVTVTAFDKNGNTYTATSDAYGKYAFSAANSNAIAAANFPVRVEFTNFPANVSANSGPSITGNKSSVRFVSSPSCSLDCGGVNPLNYSQANPPVFSNLYTNGDPLGGGTAGTTDALIEHSYTQNTDYAYTTIAKSSQVGTVWAKAWNKYKKKLFVAAILKRHSGLGPLGLGGIYALDYSNPASPALTNFLDVTTLGIDIGQSGVPSNSARGLNANKLTPNADAAVFALVGKAGIGNMDLSEDGNTLYFMNLKDNKVYGIDITAYLSSGTAPTAADVTSYSVPNPGCTNGSYHAFALKVYNGKMYVGMVCDGSTGTKSNMVAFVKAMDLTTNTWSDIFDFPLTYPKGYPDQGDGSKTGWYNWSDNISTVWNGSGNILHPVPMLSDIEFDLDGTMVLALMDRTDMQMGNYNYDNAAYNAGNFTAAGGDVLRAFYSNGAYVLENNAKAGPNTGYFPNNNQGPGFGEFYNDNIDGGVTYHTEMVTGGITLVPGSGEVMVGMVDPSFYKGGPLWANGPRRLSNTTGNHTGGMAYYSESGISNFGKGVGMGDLEAAPDDLTYIEIGNYVWSDVNGNGIQDPTESGIAGVSMKLFNTTTGALVATTTTDANGNYYFSTLSGVNLQPNTQYTVVAGAGQYNSATGEFVVGGKKYAITQTNTGEGANATLNDNNFSDSDLSTSLGAMPANLPKFTLTTGNPGYINHTIDLGLTYGTLGNYVWYDDNLNGLQDEATNRGINGTKVYLYKDNGTGTFVIVDSATTANDGSGNPGYYNFQIGVSGDYKVKFPSAIGTNVPTTQTTTAATDGNSDANTTTGFSPVVTMDVSGTGVAKNNPTIDAGYIPLKGSLGNYVWYDDNNDGLQNEPASNGINGQTVKLYKETTPGNYTLFATTTTANDGSGNPGYYNFPNLDNGNYKVKFPTSVGNYPISTPNNQAAQVDGNNDANASTGFSGVVAIDVVAGGLNKDNPTIDAGYRTNIGSLGNYVWRDVNGNGLQDEPASNGINGVKVYLLDGAGTIIDSTTTANNGGNPGYYNFPNLNSGNYQVQFPTMVGGYPLTPIVDQATQVDGNQDADVTTGKSGVVTINTNSSSPLDVNNPTIDAGYGLLGSLGNYVWYDDNNNGIQDEPASNGINGTKVILYIETTPGSGTYVKFDSTTTANDGSGNPGYYSFNDLFSANYKVQFPTNIGNYPISDVTNQAMQVDNNNDANKVTGFSGVVAIDVTAGGLNRDNPTIDAGYRRNIGSLGNYVWLDNNNDGINNEPTSNGVNGVKVYLLNGAGTKIDSTVTANDGSGNPGYYNFPNLLSATYSVQFPTNIGNYPVSDVTNQTSQIDNNNDANKVTGKSGSVVINTASNNPLDVNNPTIDAGYRTNIGSLGNYVWYDVDGNGLQNEPASNGVNGVKVYLLNGAGTKIDSTVTANDGSGNPGYYNFPNLNSGNYQVQFPTTSGGFNLTNQTTTAKTDGNSDAANATGKSPVVAIVTNSNNPLDVNNPTIDAGYVPVGSLGNYVWYDANKNGLQDEPAVNGLNDIKVILYKETAPGVYTKVDSTITANDSTGKSGWYTFDNLVKGNYKVQFPTSEGSYFLTPTNNQAAQVDGNNDANSAGFSGIVPINPLLGGLNKNNPTIDAGYYCDCNGFKVDIVINKTFDCVTGNSFSFSANINRTGGSYTYSWDFGDGTTSTLANPTHTYATAGEYDVKLTVVENSFCGCRYEASVRQIYVGPKPHVDFDWQYNGNCLTYDFNSTSTISMGWIAGFNWDFGNGTTSTQSNPLATYATAGVYNVKLVVTSNYGCKDSITYAVNIINKCNYTPCPAIGTINATTTTLCVGSSTTLTDTTAGGTWSSSNTSVATISNSGVVTAIAAGSTTISYTVIRPCGTVVAYATVTVFANAAQPITGIDSVCVGQNITLSNTNTGGVYIASNTNASINNSGNVLGATVGLDTITYTVTTPCGTFTSTKVINVVNSCNVTSGGGGGVESKTLGDVIAVRLYGNAINSVSTTGNTGVQFTNSGAIVNGINNLKLSDLVPATVANTDAAYVTTPSDLVNFTNAVEVLAVDYSKGSATKAVAFGTKTLGDVYTHTKPICDRLKGAELQEVKNIVVNGFNLMAYKVHQRTGETEYAINLSAGTAANRNSISLQSNWFTDSYQQDEKLYNFQLWAVSYEMVTAMATDIITKLQANGSVNTVTNADLPKAYISKGSRVNTNLNVTINNNTANTTGYFELKEKANEAMSDAQITTRQIPFTVNANGISNITIPVRDNYEGNIYVYLNNKLTDLVYLSDGTWALDYNKNTTTISSFNVTNEANPTTATNEHRLFRNVAVTGTSKDYITVYKTMMGGGLEQNVSNLKSLVFNANATGAGSVTVTLVKKSIADWKNQYTYTVALEGNKEYGINLSQFTSKANSNAIDANDITAVNFSFNNSRGVPTNMSINLSKARFASTSIATDVSVNTVAIYPNPTVGKFTTSFTSTSNQSLVLKVTEAATGKIVKTQFITATKGTNQVVVDNNLSSGLYIVTLEGDADKFNPTKLIVNKK